MGKLIILNVFLNFMNLLFILTNKKNMCLFYCLILYLPPVPKGGIKTHFLTSPGDFWIEQHICQGLFPNHSSQKVYSDHCTSPLVLFL